MVELIFKKVSISAIVRTLKKEVSKSKNYYTEYTEWNKDLRGINMFSIGISTTNGSLFLHLMENIP